MLPLYTRFLTTSDYGKLDIIQTTISLLIPLITLQAVEAVFRYSIDMKERGNVSTVLVNGLLLCFVGMIVSLLLYPVFKKFEPFSSYVGFFYAIMFLSMTDSIMKQFVRGLGKTTVFVVSDLAYTVSVVSFSILFLIVVRLGLQGYFLSMVLAHLVSIVVLLTFGNVVENLGFRSFDRSLLKSMLIYSVPLIPNGLMWWVMSVSDRYMLTYFIGFDATGIYSVSYKFPSLITLVNSIFFMAWQLSAMEEYGRDGYERFYRNVFGALSSLLLVSTSFVLVILKPLLMIFVAEAFYESWKYVPLLLVGTVFQAFSSFFGTNYTASKKTKGAFSTSVVGAIVNIGINFALIPIWGIQAAAFSTMAAYVAMWLMRVKDTQKFVKIEVDWRNLLLSLTVIGIQILGLYLIENTLIFLAFGSALILVLLFVQRKYIQQVYSFGMRLLSEIRSR